MSNLSYKVGFDVFPNYTSSFKSYIKEDRLFSFAQLHSVMEGPGTFQAWFSDAVIVNKHVEDNDGEALRHPRIPRKFSSEEVFDHILSRLGINYLDHTSISFHSFDVVGDTKAYHADAENRTIHLGALELRGDQQSLIIGPSSLRTNDEAYAKSVKQRLQQIKTYFSSIMESAALGVSHKHYIKYLLEAFPGRVQVRQLPAMYAEFEPLHREAKSLSRENRGGWKSLAKNALETAEDLDRDVSMDERRFIVEVCLRANGPFLDDALRLANEKPRQFATRNPEIVMEIVDAKRIRKGEDQVFNTMEPEQRDLDQVEEALFDRLRGKYGNH